MADDESPRWEPVMPFILALSQGGPHDDEAFVSGYRLGALDTRLSIMRALSVSEPDSGVFRAGERNQVDLVAMRHGYVSTSHGVHDDGEWETIGFAIGNYP